MVKNIEKNTAIVKLISETFEIIKIDKTIIELFAIWKRNKVLNNYSNIKLGILNTFTLNMNVFI